MYRQLLRYNARICTSLGPWLLVVPIAATMLVLFALMAMTSLIRESTPVLIMELLGSLLMAFVGVSLLRPEYQHNTLETVLTRPVSFRTILTVRMLFAGLGVLALQALLCLYMKTVMGKEINSGLALLSTGVSMAFLAALAAAVAAGWRSPTFGFIVAAAFWVIDLVAGPRLNPLLTLHGYAEHIADPDGVFATWWPSKALLLGLALILAAVAARAGGRPAVQRNARLWLRTGALVLAVAVAYVASGASYMMSWGMRHEAELLNQSRLWYRHTFGVYSPLPVPYLFGSAFPRFMGYRPPWVRLRPGVTGGFSARRHYDMEQLRIAAFGYPDSAWADNALYELGRMSLSEEDEGEAGESTVTGVQCLELLVKEHASSPFAPMALEKLYAIYERLGRQAEAKEAADRLLSLYPNALSAHAAGQALLVRLSDPEAAGGPRLQDALALAQRLTATANPDQRPGDLEAEGWILGELGRYDKAAAKLREAMDAARERSLELIAIEDRSSEQENVIREMAGVRERAREALEELQAEGKIGPQGTTS